MANISDVANATGLSRATISRVINNHPYVSEENKELVRKAMNELGYYPNSSAQRLRNQRTDLVAVLIPRLTNPFFTSILEGIENVASQNGLQLLICQTKNEKKKEINFLKLLKSKQVDGIILTSIENDWNVIEQYLDCGPIILCNEYYENATCPMVRLNQVQGSYLGIHHLLERGYRKIGYCCGGLSSGLSQDRRKGIETALSEFGLTLNEEWIFSGAFDINDGVTIMNQVLSFKERPEALFAGGDEVASGIIKEAKRNGLKIPDDIAVLGFDDQPVAELIVPTLTTIHQPGEDIGHKVMEVMIDILNDNLDPRNQKIYELPIKLVVRDST